MASSSLSVFSLSSLSPHHKPAPSKTPTFSLLSSPKPRTRRRNHLRRKLPTQTRPLEPAILETPQLPLLVQEVEEAEKVESVEPVRELTHQSQTLQPLPNPNPSGRSFILDLSLRFAALLAVQTVAAVWILGGSGRNREEEEARVGVLEEEKVVGERENVKEGSDLERMVSEIRAMAREARVQEVKELERREIERERLGFKTVGMGKKEKVEEGLSGGKLGSRKRLEFVKSNVSRRMIVGKGFNGMEKVEGDSNVGDGGMKIYFLLIR